MDAAEKIREGFRELLCTIPYDQITITQILEISAVSRKTFYRHYESKGDLVSALFTADFIEPVRAIRKILPFDQIKSAAILGLENSYQTLYDNREIYLNLAKHYGEWKLLSTMVELTTKLNETIYCQYDLSAEEVRYAAHTQAILQPMLIHYWNKEAFATPPKRMAKLHNDWFMSHFRELGIAFNPTS